MQAGDYADDPVMEAYLQLLAADKSKVSSPCNRRATLFTVSTFAHAVSLYLVIHKILQVEFGIGL